MFELTNAQRKCFALPPVLDTWNKVDVKANKLQKPTTNLFGHNDHRIVMALSVLLTKIGGEIYGAEAVNKSYPTFFEDLLALNCELKIYEDN